MKSSTLILGLGNEILSDDGVGIKLANDLADSITIPGIKFDTACCGGIELIEIIKGFNRVIFIDGIRTNNGIPAEVYHFRPSDFRETMHLSSLHDISFLTALKLAEKLSIEIPRDLHIIAIEIIEDREFSTELTPLIRDAYPVIFNKVANIVNMICHAD